MSGFAHPLLGWDHVIAMLAVGLWGAFLGALALWLLPVVFPLVMAAGGAPRRAGRAAAGGGNRHRRLGGRAGGVVAGALRPPLWVAALLVALFAIFHGHAHGTELPQAGEPAGLQPGFVVATGHCT